MRLLNEILSGEIGFGRVFDSIDCGGCPVAVAGLDWVHRAHLAAAMRHRTKRPVLVVCSDEMEATRLAADIQSLAGEPVDTLFSREYVFFNVEGVSRQLEHGRIRAMYRMLAGAPLVVATVDGLMQRTLPPKMLSKLAFRLKAGDARRLEHVLDALDRCGYSRCQQVEGPGQYAVRGGILDFFSPAEDEPCRCEFFGDEVDSVNFFDVSTQRRTQQCDGALILPVAETLPACTNGESAQSPLADRLKTLLASLEKRKGFSAELRRNLQADIDRLESGRLLPAADRYMELIYPMAAALDYADSTAVLLICDPTRVAERAKNYLWSLGEDCKALLEAGVMDSSLVRFSLSWEDFCLRAEGFATVMAGSFATSSYPIRPKAVFNISAKHLPSYGGSLDTAAEDILHYTRSAYRVVVLCRSSRRAELLSEFLRERSIPNAIDLDLTEAPSAGDCRIALGALSAGMEYPSAKLAVITEGQLLAPVPSRRRKRASSPDRERLQSFSDLSPGDLVVHELHGIGRYLGMSKLTVDGADKDYIKIAYAGSDVLYVPATQLDLVSKYIGGRDDDAVRLSKLGGSDWARAKSRAKGAAKEIARELIRLYAERQRIRGRAFSPDSAWQTEFEQRFEYEETDDQLRCIEEIKADMERPVPMDRLLCGDVGYGKTEVALRAVMKCVLDGCQAAILVPTTVLAQQHYATALRRFAGYPVRIELLSRFKAPAQIGSVLKDLESGAVDVVIGTHRLLQKDVKFKNLGLLIVDEEQRFGVAHKERLKEIAKHVDVLTLSATPIPRTLNMALSGLRDLSTIEEPPRDRQPVQTYVLEHDWGVVCDAIRREIARGGQVYYLHNRVDTIERTALRLKEMLDGVTVAVAHGQMDEDSLSRVMERMAAGEIQVLVCTTIIETGIDIPNVNTLIIEDADRLGLAQLHQIRGRVGRSPRRAYAYLTFRPGKVLTETAEKRLSAIREFAEFNSGFKIAMRDLEIRGAGNLLGAEQSGHMASVGYDMYLKLLEEAVAEEKGEPVEKRVSCSADLSVAAHIPEKYVPSAEQRMDLYRRIALVRTEEDADEMIAELIDRYGDPPAETVSLVSIALLRSEASLAGISDITQKSDALKFSFDQFAYEKISALYNTQEYNGRLKVEAGSTPAVSLRLRSTDALGEALKFVRAYSRLQ